MTRHTNRYWGEAPVPKSKSEFFNAVTTPAPAGDGTVATIRIYGPIDSWGGWWGVCAKDVGTVLDALPDTVTQIVLRINSPGGEVFEGVSILNMLRAHKATVLGVVDGLAASAASVIAAGCDDTVMSPGTQMMIHSPTVIAWGNSTELRKSAEVLDSIELSLIDIYRDKAGEKNWAQLLADETWLTAAEAVALGLADRTAVIPDAGETETVGSDPAPLEADFQDSLVAMFGDSRNLDRAAARSSMLPRSSEPGDPNRKESVVAYDDLKAGFAKRLGIPEAEVTDEVLFAALDETLAEQSDPAAPVAAPIPEGAVVMDAAALSELQASAALGVQARAEQISARRDAIVASALSEGRITPESRERWRAQLDVDETGITALLAGFPKSSAIPVDEIGRADQPTDADEALYASAWGSTPKEA